MLATENHISSEIRRVILDHLKEKLDAASISTGRMALAVRQQLPNCILTDRELTDLIAATVIEAGFAVSFEHIDPPFDNDNTGNGN